jgi:hypothetical protein
MLRPVTAPDVDSSAISEWAQAHGTEVSGRAGLYAVRA